MPQHRRSQNQLFIVQNPQQLIEPACTGKQRDMRVYFVLTHFFAPNKNPMQNYSASDALLLILIKSSISSCRSLLISESPAISRSTVKTALTVMLPW